MKYYKGDDYQEGGCAFQTYGISHDNHTNMIEIHGSEKLRDTLLKLLNKLEAAFQGYVE